MSFLIRKCDRQRGFGDSHSNDSVLPCVARRTGRCIRGARELGSLAGKRRRRTYRVKKAMLVLTRRPKGFNQLRRQTRDILARKPYGIAPIAATQRLYASIGSSISLLLDPPQ